MGRTKKIVNGTREKISQKTINYNTMYSFTNIKDGSLTGTEMTALLTPAYEGFIVKDSVYYCCESGGAYSEGHFYQFTITGTSPVDNVASWTDLGTLGGGKTLITLTGESGTLTDSEIAKVLDNSAVVEFKIGNNIYKYAENQGTFVTYTSVVYPTTTTQEIRALYIQIDNEAVNYKTWSLEDITIGGGSIVTFEEYA